MASMAVANEIVRQLGNGTLYMLGAKNLIGDENGVTFKVGRNSKGVSHVRVELAADDTYTVEFTRVRMRNYDVTITKLATLTGIYVDGLHRVIEENTGLYTSL